MIIFTGCDNSAVDPDINDLGINYFPLNNGDYRIYDVEEIIFSVLGNDTSIYQLKETVVDFFVNSSGDLSYTLHRFSRTDAGTVWGLDSIWTARRSLYQAIAVENNIPFIKLVFPLKEDVIWDGNALNGIAMDEYEMRDIFEIRTIFDEEVKTVTVLQGDEEDLLFKDERTEIFGENIGLLEKRYEVLEFCDDNDCFGKKIVDRGRFLKMNLIEYGNE